MSAVGSGATIPYLFVYLHQVCGVAVAMVGALMTVRALIAVLGALLGGPLADRLGPRAAAVLGLIGASAGSVALAAASSPLWGMAAVVLCIIACAVMLPSLDALLAVAVPEERRQTAFAWRQTVINLGGAAGAAIASLALGWWSVTGGLRAVYLLDGISFAVFAVLVGTVVRSGSRVDVPATEAPDAPRGVFAGYRLVFADRSMRWLCVVVAVFTGAGFAQLQVGLPGLVTTGGADATGLGWMMSANMVAVLVLQLPVQRLVVGRPRAQVLAASLAAVMAAWALVLLTPGDGGSTLLLVLVGVVFAIAETLFTPVVPALVNDLAPALTRGRYNGAQAAAWTGGWLIGAAVAGAFVAAGPGPTRALFAVCTFAVVLGMVAARRLHQVLPSTLTRVPTAQSGKTDPHVVAEAST
ncbi:MFS transporter [Streptomyces sp. NPDC057909]|uniref:MFS transporter n=1 Tax=Streptomyces sp. NPDC057909 TaxID=3346277 RepID=UPI0036EB4605